MRRDWLACTGRTQASENPHEGDGSAMSDLGDPMPRVVIFYAERLPEPSSPRELRDASAISLRENGALFKDIGRYLNVSVERSRQIYRKAIRRDSRDIRAERERHREAVENERRRVEELDQYRRELDLRLAAEPIKAPAVPAEPAIDVREPPAVRALPKLTSIQARWRAAGVDNADDYLKWWDEERRQLKILAFQQSEAKATERNKR